MVWLPRVQEGMQNSLGDSDCTLDPDYVTGVRYNMVGCAVIALALFASTCFSMGGLTMQGLHFDLCGKFSQHEMVQRSRV